MFLQQKNIEIVHRNGKHKLVGFVDLGETHDIMSQLSGFYWPKTNVGFIDTNLQIAAEISPLSSVVLSQVFYVLLYTLKYCFIYLENVFFEFFKCMYVQKDKLLQ